MTNCRVLHVYPDGFYSEEPLQGLQEAMELRVCSDGSLEARWGGGDWVKLDLSSLIRRLRSSDARRDEDGVLISVGVRKVEKILNSIVKSVEDLDNALLALILDASPYRLDRRRRLLEALAGGAQQ